MESLTMVFGANLVATGQTFLDLVILSLAGKETAESVIVVGNSLSSEAPVAVCEE